MMSLRTYLQTNKINQADFAEQIGATQGYVSKLARGEVKNPPFATIAAINAATNGAVPFEVWLEASPHQEEKVKKNVSAPNEAAE